MKFSAYEKTSETEIFLVGVLPLCRLSDHFHPNFDGQKFWGAIIYSPLFRKHYEEEHCRHKQRLLHARKSVVEHPRSTPNTRLTRGKKELRGTIITSLADSMVAIHRLEAILQMIMEDSDRSGSGGSFSANIRWMWTCVS